MRQLAILLLLELSVGAYRPTILRADRRACCSTLRMQLGDEPLPEDAPEVWDDSSFASGEESFVGGVAADDGLWAVPQPAAVAPPAPPRELRPIETVTVGVVSGPYKRRRGFHAEVMVQHPGASPSKHVLWFAHEVLQDVAKLRDGAEEHHVDVEGFAEATVRFLKEEKGVDLADPEWGMDDDSIPYSVEHMPLRTLFAMYEELPEYLAKSLLDGKDLSEVAEATEEEAENMARYTHELETGVHFPCLGALAPDGSGEIIGEVMTGEPVWGDTSKKMELEGVEEEEEAAVTDAVEM